MKNPALNFLLLIFLFVANKSYAQCNFNDDTLKVGQVLTSVSTCPSSGTITVNNATGGGGTYAYEIIDGPVVRIIQSQNVFNALPAGEYIVRVSSCNGDITERTVNVTGSYTSIYQYGWQNGVQKVSGLSCGVTNDGVYKLSKPSYTGGTAPFRIQLSQTPSFSSVPYLPGYDSALFNGLNQSTTYYVRVTDACNNFITFNFLTPLATAVVPLSVPTLVFQRGYYYGECTGQETMYLYLRDSATGGYYSGANTFINKVFWGNKEKPYLRIKVENDVTNELYLDRNMSITQSGNAYYLNQDYSIAGETGLMSPGIGKSLYYRSVGDYYLPDLYASSSFPMYAQLRTTIYFPGGDHCGTSIPAYSRTFRYTLARQYPAQVLITGISPNCNTAGNYLRVDLNRAYSGDTISLIKLAPSYAILQKQMFGTGTNTYTTITYSPLVPGETYRVIVKDSCGRTDSMDVVYTPSFAIVPAPAVTDEYRANFKCPANPNDTMYNIIVRSLPTGYSILNIMLDGYTISNYTAINNWNGTNETVYQINTKLPPGTYSYKVTWLNNCQTGTVSKSITISPIGDPPTYTRDLVLSLYNQPGACYTDGFRAINIDGFIRNINTNYRFANLRLVSGPNAYIYPIFDKRNIRLEGPGESIYMTLQVVGDSMKIRPSYSGLKINTGQEGNYTFAIDIVCPDGTLVETLTKSFNITSTVPSVPYTPDLKYSNALVCASSGSQLKINMFATGGKRPFTYEFKRDTAVNYSLTGNSGADSIVAISPAPDPGTIYDIRVTDACGVTSTNRVTVASFTGEFFIYGYPADCKNNPFNTRVGTSWIRGAYYTWKRNGNIVAQGYNMYYVNLMSVIVDSVSVDVDLYNCYSGFAERMVVSPNPCGITILPVNSLKLTGNRTTAFNVQLTWKSVNEQQSIKYFDLEKSTDGRNFTRISRVVADEKAWEHSYVYNDQEAAALVYYRLITHSKDDKEYATPIIKIENAKVNKTQLAISPNPAHDNISLSINTDKIKPYKAKIFNDKGQVVKEVSLSVDEITSKKIDISLLATGSYFISLIDNWEVVASAKFIKQ